MAKHERGFIMNYKTGKIASTQNIPHRYCIRMSESEEGLLEDEIDVNGSLVVFPLSPYRLSKRNMREATVDECKAYEKTMQGKSREEIIIEHEKEIERLKLDVPDSIEVLCQKYRTMKISDINLMKKDKMLEVLEVGFGKEIVGSNYTRSEVYQMIKSLKKASNEE